MLPRSRAVAAALAAAAAAAALAAPSALAQAPEVVADGLSNPRGMTFGPHGKLYVAESGRGGDGKCIVGPEGGEQCEGRSGAIARIDVRSGAVERVITNLPSLGDPAAGGAAATGPNDVSFHGWEGYFTVGLGADPRLRDQLGWEGQWFASLYRFGTNGRYGKVSDLGKHEEHANPDKGNPSATIDSNPFGVQAFAEHALVTDAGGNDLLAVDRRGFVDTVAVFPFGEAPPPGAPEGTPPIPVQPVPTGIAAKDEDTVLVGQLTGFPFPVGGANVFAANRFTGLSVFSPGFTNVIDVAVGKHGTVYVLQLTTTGLAGPPSRGKLIRIDPDGTQTELAAGQLTTPTGLAVSRRGTVYVANQGFSPDAGQILRIPVES